EPRGDGGPPRVETHREGEDDEDPGGVHQGERREGPDPVEEAPGGPVVNGSAGQHSIVGQKRPQIAGVVDRVVKNRQTQAHAEDGQRARVHRPKPERARQRILGASATHGRASYTNWGRRNPDNCVSVALAEEGRSSESPQVIPKIRRPLTDQRSK